jgi:ketosteroid isomerase-like protein
MAMEKEKARQFIDALHSLERDGDVSELVGLFAEDCEITNVLSERVFRGRDGARLFWCDYRSYFTELDSEITNVVQSGDRIALEWVSHGTNLRGAPVTYDGITMLQMKNGRVHRFHAYFNPAVLSDQLESAPPPY